MNKFPSIYRRITDLPFRILHFFKAISTRIAERHRLASYIITILFLSLTLFSIAAAGFDLLNNVEREKQLDKEKQEIISEINYWKEIADKYKNYRDGYFELAILEYRLNDLEKAKLYLQKVFAIDPNFQKGRELEQILDSNISTGARQDRK